MKLKQIDNIYLLDFLTYSRKLVDLYSVPRNSLSTEWIDLKVSISNSIISLYKYSNDLYTNELFKNNKNSIRFYSFYFDLILSKLRHSLFTETPKDSFADLYPSSAKEIASIAQELFNSQEIDDTFDTNFQRLVFKIFIMYDFIFYKDEGCFTSFELNKDLFMKIKDSALLPVKGSDSKDFGQNVIMNILSDTLDDRTSENIYNMYIDKTKESPIKIEPFSYFLGFKIWKISKIIHATLEFKNIKDLDANNKEFKNKFKIYLEEQKQIVNDFYSNKITNIELFQNITKLDKLLLNDSLFKKSLCQYRDDSIEYRNRYNIQGIETSSKDNILEKLLQKMISNSKEDHDRFKFYRVLEDKDTTIKDLAYLIELMGQNINKSEDLEIVGMLRSGMLLAHCINISQGLYKPVIMFSSFPYISFLPRINRNSTNIVFVDESIKSGFSTELANLYKQRTLNMQDVNIFNYTSKVISIVNFKDFKKEQTISTNNSIANLNIKNNQVVLDKESIVEDEISMIFDWKKYFDTLQEDDIQNIDVQVDVVPRLDVTKLLANSNSLFYVAKLFADELSSIDDEKIILYSSTDEGKLLVDSTIFAYKVLYPENKKTFYLNKQKAKDRYVAKKIKLIIVDMTIDSMATIARTLRFDFGLDLDKADKYFTIFASEESKVKLKDKLFSIKSLRD